jgi:hypothetical protein
VYRYLSEIAAPFMTHPSDGCSHLTDEGYFNGKLNLVGFFGREQGNPGVPRTWGLSFKRTFK